MSGSHTKNPPLTQPLSFWESPFGFSKKCSTLLFSPKVIAPYLPSGCMAVRVIAF